MPARRPQESQRAKTAPRGRHAPSTAWRTTRAALRGTEAGTADPDTPRIETDRRHDGQAGRPDARLAAPLSDRPGPVDEATEPTGTDGASPSARFSRTEEPALVTAGTVPHALDRAEHLRRLIDRQTGKSSSGHRQPVQPTPATHRAARPNRPSEHVRQHHGTTNVSSTATASSGESPSATFGTFASTHCHTRCGLLSIGQTRRKSFRSR